MECGSCCGGRGGEGYGSVGVGVEKVGNCVYFDTNTLSELTDRIAFFAGYENGVICIQDFIAPVLQIVRYGNFSQLSVRLDQVL